MANKFYKPIGKSQLRKYIPALFILVSFYSCSTLGIIKYNQPLFDKNGEISTDVSVETLGLLKANKAGNVVLSRFSYWDAYWEDNLASSNCGSYCSAFDILSQKNVVMERAIEIDGIKKFIGSDDFPYNIHDATAISDEGSVIAGAGCGPKNDTKLFLWNSKTGKIMKYFSLKLPISRLLFSADGKTLAFGEYTGRVGIIDLSNGTRVGYDDTYKPGTTLASMVESLSWSPDGKTLYSGHADGRIRAWPIDGKSPSMEAAGRRDGPVACVAASPDGKILYSSGFDGKMRLHEVATGKLLKEVNILGIVPESKAKDYYREMAYKVAYSRFVVNTSGSLVAWGPLILDAQGCFISYNGMISPYFSLPCFILNDTILMYGEIGIERESFCALTSIEEQHGVSFHNLLNDRVYVPTTIVDGTERTGMYEKQKNGEWKIIAFTVPPNLRWGHEDEKQTYGEALAEYKKTHRAEWDAMYDPNLEAKFFAAADFIRQGSELLAKGKTADARAVFSYCVSKKIDVARAYAGLGSCYQIDNNVDLARASYLKALELEPDIGVCYTSLARLSLRDSKPAQALYFLSRGEPYNRTDPSFYALYGAVMVEKGLRGQALPFLLRAISLDPHYESAYPLIFACFENLGLTKQRDALLAIYGDVFAVKGQPGEAPQGGKK